MKLNFKNSQTKIGTIIKATALGLAISTTLSACSPRISTHGNYPREDQVEIIESGKATKQTVFKIYGPPSTVSTFDSETWYYMVQKFERFAFYEPEIIEMNVMAVYFDDKGNYVQSQTYTLDDIRKIAIEESTTATSGHRLSFMQQMFGNFGKTN